ncbi:MAG TPA: GMC family oxidoreductase [Candidatus Baltobacteraceae bacterium]|nr:GMC family oxidoreductase [Candidatus Baltobacteraceae bacterium]
MKTIRADVAIVGTGAGGGTAAEILAQHGLRVVLVEEGPLRTAADFDMRESTAYPQLYQESAARKTLDKAITILQGRAVGGSTTVNWTSSFRTPPETLAYWSERLGVKACSAAEMAPWFELMERRLHIAPWNVPPNENNAVLAAGARQLGIETGVVPRNVNGCRNLGYCGMGCPVNAKQSMLVTTIPAAIKHGAILLHSTHAERFDHDGSSVTALVCRDASDAQITVKARHYILAAGAIGSPAVLLRSGVRDRGGHTGARTFLHPVVLSAAIMPQPVEGFAGAPQSVYSDHFLHLDRIDGPIGFKLEVPPIHPVLAASTLTGFGEQSASLMSQLPNVQVLIALLRDGFHDGSPGGTVRLQDDGTPVLDYPLTPYIWEGARRALMAMANIQFAAGASSVLPLHEDAQPYGSLAQAFSAIRGLRMEPLRTRIVSAHVMGGCAMSEDPSQSVVDSFGSHHELRNLSVFDGSIFPTSLGANPQLSIYGFTARNATRLARTLTGK